VGLFRGKGKAGDVPATEEPGLTPVPATLLLGEETLEVVGDSPYQDNLWRLVGGLTEQPVHQDCIAVLILEDDDPHDHSAIAVQVHGMLVGRLAVETAARYRRGLERLMRRYGQLIALEGVIVGAGHGEDGVGRLGVVLTHDPRDFG
jgi:hypothetical protein